MATTRPALLSGKGPGARKEFHYVTDDGDYAAFRYGKWKISFLTQEAPGFDVWDALTLSIAARAFAI